MRRNEKELTRLSASRISFLGYTLITLSLEPFTVSLSYTYLIDVVGMSFHWLPFTLCFLLSRSFPIPTVIMKYPSLNYSYSLSHHS